MAQTVLERARRREHRLVLLVRAAAVVLGAGLAVATTGLGQYGQGPMLAASVFGLVVLAGTALGETVVRPHLEPGPRTASLTPRRVRDHLPRSAGILLALVVVTVVVLALTTATASRAEDGHLRALSCSGPAVAQSHSPYPGAFYAVPLLVALVVVLATAALAARQVVLRPRAGTGGTDDLARRDSLETVVAAAGLAVAAPLAGIAVTAGLALRGLGTATPTCAPGWTTPAGWSLVLVALVAFLVAATFLGRLLVPPVERR